MNGADAARAANAGTLAAACIALPVSVLEHAGLLIDDRLSLLTELHSALLHGRAPARSR